MKQTLQAKSILLIIGGGIAAYKSLELIRRLRERGAKVRVVMTAAAQQFITPLAAGALSADHVFTDLFDRQDEQDVGHIRLARGCDLIVVAPATADLMAKAANGHANDLASAVLLATNKPVLFAPAMNPAMWSHPATRRNRATLAGDGIHFVGPARGEMAESGEAGEGRMSEPLEIVAASEAILQPAKGPLSGRKIIVTSGPTHEPIDPVRYIANRSSGKQGHALAAALAKLGADVRLVSGPVSISDPDGVTVTHVETARQMQAAVEAQLPADAAVFVAAVADWRTEGAADQKIKKVAGEGPPALQMVENPDILAGIGHHKQRPYLVVGFAAETQALDVNAAAKLKKKGADFIVANDVSVASIPPPLTPPLKGEGGQDASAPPENEGGNVSESPSPLRGGVRGGGKTHPTPAQSADPQGEGKNLDAVAGGVMGGDRNRVKIVSKAGVEAWPEMTKAETAARLAALIAEKLKTIEV